MTAQNIHLVRIKEHSQVIRDAKAVGIEFRPATIGFHTSACAIDLLELYLHKAGKIPIGAIIKHEWFKRPKQGQKIMPLAERNLKADFPNKAEIFELIYTLEEKRNKLVYGHSIKPDIKQASDTFDKYRQLLKEMLLKEGIEIEEPDY